MEYDLLLSSSKAGVTVSIIALSSLDWCLAEVNISWEVPLCPPSSKPNRDVAPSLFPTHRRMLFHRGNCRNKVPQNELRQIHKEFLLQEAGTWQHEGDFFSYFYVNTSATFPSHVKTVLSITSRKWLKACCSQLFSIWLIIIDNLSLVNENDENLEVVYSISNISFLSGKLIQLNQKMAYEKLFRWDCWTLLLRFLWTHQVSYLWFIYS